jgi:hypothetical protein
MANFDYFHEKFPQTVGASYILGPLTFDPAVLTLFEGILRNETIVIFSKNAILDGTIEAVLSKEIVSHVFMTPSLFRRLQQIKNSSLRNVLLGGEPCPAYDILLREGRKIILFGFCLS